MIPAGVRRTRENDRPTVNACSSVEPIAGETPELASYASDPGQLSGLRPHRLQRGPAAGETAVRIEVWTITHDVLI